MGIGDKTDPTTDFFDTHRAQCLARSAKIRSVPEATATVTDMDQAVALCDVAIANGRQRLDMPAVVTKMPALVTKYQALSAITRTAAEKEDAPIKAASEVATP